LTESPGKEPVKNHHNFASDDEDDTLLFARMQEYVLEHYPNPQRIGCLDRDTLSTFVMAPGKLDLSDLKYLHIVKCAECTRELMELRRIREEQLQQVPIRSASSPRTGLPLLLSRKFRAAAMSMCALAVAAVCSWKIHFGKSAATASNEAEVSVTIDLSSDVVSRSVEAASPERPTSLPRKLVNLHLILPYYSPAGNYRVTVSRERSSSSVEALVAAAAIIQGPRTEIFVKLDLRKVHAGSYFLGTIREGDGASSFHPLDLD
jgi:hypothetical protein